jgi:putative transcription factor|tara:strand:- start:710 stop:1168 length:459 start_codon:yes stop_codon:yes gene_type:complete
MPRCDMCGKESEIFLTNIEGTELNVCGGCSKFGKVIRKVNTQPVTQRETRQQKTFQEEETATIIKAGFGNLIKNAREKLGLKQEDFAKKINEKTSLIHSLESEHHEPSIKAAEKIEKFLNINLVEEIKLEKTNLEHKDSGALTIGDMIKIKK